MYLRSAAPSYLLLTPPQPLNDYLEQLTPSETLGSYFLAMCSGRAGGLVALGRDTWAQLVH